MMESQLSAVDAVTGHIQPSMTILESTRLLMAIESCGALTKDR